MRAFAFLATSLLALGVQAHDSYHAHLHAERNLVAREAINPSLVCGDSFTDCGNGFCCKAGGSCSTYQNVPVCKVSDSDYDNALPYDDTALAAAQTALSYVIASMTASSSSSSSLAAYTTSASSATPTYGYSQNSTTAYSSPTPYPTGGVTTGYGNSTATTSATTSLATFVNGAPAARVEGGLGVSLVMGVVGMLQLLW